MRKDVEDLIGTCQACFGEYKVDEARARLVLHGYRRPGHGFVVGSCLGVDAPPFEHEHALTDQVIASHRTAAAGRRDDLEKLRTGTTTRLTRRFAVHNPETRRDEPRTETVEPGHEHWERTLAVAIAQAEADARHHEAVAAFLQARVDAWTHGTIIGIDAPATGRMRELRDAYDPEQAEAAARRAEAKAARDAKPGKLLLLLYTPRPDRPDGEMDDDARRTWFTRREAARKEWSTRVRNWAKANLDEGRVVAREGYDFDLPRSIRERGSFDVVRVNADWRYRDEIETMLTDVLRHVDEPKSVAFAARMD